MRPPKGTLPKVHHKRVTDLLSAGWRGDPSDEREVRREWNARFSPRHDDAGYLLPVVSNNPDVDEEPIEPLTLAKASMNVFRVILPDLSGAALKVVSDAMRNLFNDEIERRKREREAEEIHAQAMLGLLAEDDTPAA